MLKTFEVDIVVTLRKTVTISAENKEASEYEAEDMYRKGYVALNQNGDFDGVVFIGRERV